MPDKRKRRYIGRVEEGGGYALTELLQKVRQRSVGRRRLPTLRRKVDQDWRKAFFSKAKHSGSRLVRMEPDAAGNGSGNCLYFAIALQDTFKDKRADLLKCCNRVAVLTDV